MCPDQQSIGCLLTCCADAAELATGMQQLGIDSGNAPQQSAEAEPADAPDEYSDDGEPPHCPDAWLCAVLTGFAAHVFWVNSVVRV